MKSPINRIKFDPNNQFHRQAYFQFLLGRRWTMYFELEQPWLELPAMIERKLLLWYNERELAK